MSAGAPCEAMLTYYTFRKKELRIVLGSYQGGRAGFNFYVRGTSPRVRVRDSGRKTTSVCMSVSSFLFDFTRWNQHVALTDLGLQYPQCPRFRTANAEIKPPPPPPLLWWELRTIKGLWSTCYFSGLGTFSDIYMHSHTRTRTRAHTHSLTFAVKGISASTSV